MLRPTVDKVIKQMNNLKQDLVRVKGKAYSDIDCITAFIDDLADNKEIAEQEAERADKLIKRLENLIGEQYD